MSNPEQLKGDTTYNVVDGSRQNAYGSQGHTTRKDFGILPLPKRLCYDPDKPFHFGLFLNLSFGVASTFSAFIGSLLPVRDYS